MPRSTPRLLPILLALAPAASAGEATLARTSLEHRRADGGVARAERCRLRVPIVRADPQSKPIEIDVWRFLAQAGAPEGVPPIFLLHGGPGWPGVEEHQIDWEGQVAQFTRFAELVYVGQRGIGSSTDLPCDASVVGPPPPADADDAALAELLRAASARCRAHWEAQGYDTRGLNVREAAADVADVARLLGHEKIQLYGGSFGSHWSMAVLRFHADLVARAVLNGMEGPDHTYDRPSGVLKALERMAAAAEAAPQLAGHVPEGGLIAALRAVIEGVEEEPFEVELPGAGEVRIDAEGLRGLALGVSARVSSRSGMPSWPADVLALHRGEFEAAARAIHAAQAETLTLPGAAFFGLDCGSGITRPRLAEYQGDPATALLGDLARFYESTCPAWGTDLGDEFRQGFRSAVPTLIVQGLWDVNTPFENALECLPFFERVHFIPVDGGSHAALDEALRLAPGFREALLAFLETGSLEGLPAEVALPPIAWAVPR
ncbi:MAG TPA: alpha/beta fold hydrolase [Planctomycetota bacterium]